MSSSRLPSPVFLSLSLSLFFCLSLLAPLPALAQSPTTPHIQSVFVGKCFEKNPAGTNCTALWEAFNVAGVMPNAEVNLNDYNPFFAIANFSTRPNNILFWSGNQNFAESLASDGTMYTTLEETSTGYVLNGLSWCGLPANATGGPNFDYTTPCQFLSSPGYFGTQGVWSQASHLFAQGAVGAISILLQPAMLNYSFGPYVAFRETSVFATIELPSMNASQITSATILLLANTTLAPDEVCGRGSLLTLSDRLTAKFGFPPKCVDQPEALFRILCPNGNEQTPECLAATLAFSQAVGPNPEKQDATFLLVWAIVATGVAAVALVMLIFVVVRGKKHAYTPVGH